MYHDIRLCTIVLQIKPESTEATVQSALSMPRMSHNKAALYRFRTWLLIQCAYGLELSSSKAWNVVLGGHCGPRMIPLCLFHMLVLVFPLTFPRLNMFLAHSDVPKSLSPELLTSWDIDPEDSEIFEHQSLSGLCCARRRDRFEPSLARNRQNLMSIGTVARVTDVASAHPSGLGCPNCIVDRSNFYLHVSARRQPGDRG